MAELRIGTCSWKYDSWRGLVYPDSGPFDPLQEYARHFSTVEVDQWFWSLFAGGKVVLPKTEDAERYAAVIPADFRFTIKAPNSVSLTHEYRREKSAPWLANPSFLSTALFSDFLARLKPLHDHIGLVMLQFEYLNRQKMASQGEFLERLEGFLRECPRHLPLAIEVRNPSYLDERYFRFLLEHKLHHVFCQGYYMPPVWETAERFGELLTGTVAIRLLGPDRQGIEERSGGDWSRIVAAKDDELALLVPMVARLSKQGRDVYLNVNNHFEGSAPQTIAKLRALLDAGD